ncbi:MAG: hypothetical protein MJ103_04155 [Saccharofermentans sp.]|nr:hypothetical protein [Saccharofermentans sp.]
MDRFKITIDKVAFGTCGGIGVAFGLFLLVTAFGVYGEKSEIDSQVVAAFVLGLLTLIGSIWMLADLNGFEVNVEGFEVHVKNDKKLYDFKVQDIKKVVFVERRGNKGAHILCCEISVGDNVLKFNHQYIGFLNMLEYLKKNYDSGVMKSNTISSSAYAKLNDFMERCPEGRKRARLEAKRDS